MIAIFTSLVIAAALGLLMGSFWMFLAVFIFGTALISFVCPSQLEIQVDAITPQLSQEEKGLYYYMLENPEEFTKKEFRKERERLLQVYEDMRQSSLEHARELLATR